MAATSSLSDASHLDKVRMVLDYVPADLLAQIADDERELELLASLDQRMSREVAARRIIHASVVVERPVAPIPVPEEIPPAEPIEEEPEEEAMEAVVVPEIDELEEVPVEEEPEEEVDLEPFVVFETPPLEDPRSEPTSAAILEPFPAGDEPPVDVRVVPLADLRDRAAVMDELEAQREEDLAEEDVPAEVAEDDDLRAYAEADEEEPRDDLFILSGAVGDPEAWAALGEEPTEEPGESLDDIDLLDLAAEEEPEGEVIAPEAGEDDDEFTITPRTVEGPDEADETDDIWPGALGEEEDEAWGEEDEEAFGEVDWPTEEDEEAFELVDPEEMEAAEAEPAGDLDDVEWLHEEPEEEAEDDEVLTFVPDDDEENLLAGLEAVHDEPDEEPEPLTEEDEPGEEAETLPGEFAFLGEAGEEDEDLPVAETWTDEDLPATGAWGGDEEPPLEQAQAVDETEAAQQTWPDEDEGLEPVVQPTTEEEPEPWPEERDEDLAPLDVGEDTAEDPEPWPEEREEPEPLPDLEEPEPGEDVDEEPEPLPDVEEPGKVGEEGASPDTLVPEEPPAREPVPAGEGIPVDELAGVGSIYADRLQEAGITATGDLLDVDPWSLGQETGISASLLEDWRAVAEFHHDLGLAKPLAEALARAGFGSVDDLAEEDPVEVAEKVNEVLRAEPDDAAPPTVDGDEVRGWLGERSP